MAERVAYEHIDEQLTGRRLVALQHTDAPMTRDDQILNDELASDPPPITLVAWNGADAAIAIGLGSAQRGLPDPEGPLTRDEIERRRATHIDDRPAQGYEREVGIGPGGWIEVVE